MNLQIAANMASGDGFVRHYGGTVTSPLEVQTSGLFLVIAAVAIKILGVTPLALQAANLVFLGVLLTTTYLTLKPWPVLALLSPAILVLITPAIVTYGLGGYGEFAVGALMVASFLLLSQVVEQASRPILRISVAVALLGTAFSIKSISLALTPVVVLGLVLVAITRSDVSRWRLVAACGWAVPPVAIFEVYRLVAFGSWSGWVDYWARASRSIGAEASGPGSDRQGLRVVRPGLQRVGDLGLQVGVQTSLVIAVLVVPLILLGAMFALRTCTWRQWLGQPRTALAVLLAAVVALFVPWWLFVTPLDYLRHLMVGWLALALLYLVLAGMVLTAVRQRWSGGRGMVTRNFAVLALAGLATLSAVVPLLRFSALNVDAYAHPSNFTLHSEIPGDSLAGEIAASDYARGAARAGYVLCGIGGFSAPVISLTSAISFCDLTRIDPCRGRMGEEVREGRVLLVWDNIAAYRNADGVPANDRYSFSMYAEPSPYAQFWRVAPALGACGNTVRLPTLSP